MGYCSNCGKAHKDGARFCEECGNPIGGSEENYIQGQAQMPLNSDNRQINDPYYKKNFDQQPKKKTNGCFLAFIITAVVILAFILIPVVIGYSVRKEDDSDNDQYYAQSYSHTEADD